MLWAILENEHESGAVFSLCTCTLCILAHALAAVAVASWACGGYLCTRNSLPNFICSSQLRQRANIMVFVVRYCLGFSYLTVVLRVLFRITRRTFRKAHLSSRRLLIV